MIKTSKNMRKALLSILFVVISLNAYATAQEHDLIIYKGKTYGLQSNPLERYFRIFPAKRPVGRSKTNPMHEVYSTSLWRGYVATFEIENNQLYVKDIERLVYDAGNEYEWESVIDDIFPYKNQRKIEWMTGFLILPIGEMKEYVHLGYGSLYNEYIILEFNGGNLVKEQHLNYDEFVKFKIEQFNNYKQTDEYKRAYDELKNEEWSEGQIDSFISDIDNEYMLKIYETNKDNNDTGRENTGGYEGGDDGQGGCQAERAAGGEGGHNVGEDIGCGA